MSNQVDSDFGPIRSNVWPIHRHEYKKVLPMIFMLFLLCFNYSILRNLKDSIVVTASGAEVIPFIKVWVLLPTAVLMTFIFTALSNRYSQERVFYMMTTGFLSFYLVFAFVLYPMQETLHPSTTASWMQNVLPAGFKGFIAMCCNWTTTLFYVLSELWSTMIMTVLFWGFANEVTRISEARRFYSVFGIASNVAAILAPQAANYFSQGQIYNASIPFGSNPWEQTTMVQILLVVFSGLTTMGIFRWMNRNVLTDPSYDDLHAIKREAKAKGKLSLLDSFSYLANSKYLICIAVMVIGYNLVINLVEVVWKDRVQHMYPNSSDYNYFTNNLTSYMGIVSTITSLFLAKNIARFGWTRIALVTPLIMLATSIPFFAFILFENDLAAPMIALTGLTPVAVCVYIGAMQNCLSKAAKYSVFDTTKEMSFIPLGHECKLKGKAAIDGVGSRLGKSGSSLIHQGLLIIFVTVSGSAPYVAAILLGVIGVWISTTRSLGRQFNHLVSEQKTQGVATESWQEEAPEVTAQALGKTVEVK
jgi:AAA family ATP:ADP antiporter